MLPIPWGLQCAFSESCLCVEVLIVEKTDFCTGRNEFAQNGFFGPWMCYPLSFSCKNFLSVQGWKCDSEQNNGRDFNISPLPAMWSQLSLHSSISYIAIYYSKEKKRNLPWTFNSSPLFSHRWGGCSGNPTDNKFYGCQSPHGFRVAVPQLLS